MTELNIGDTFRHYKGGIYHIVNFANDETRNEIIILYQLADKHHDQQLHARTLSDFTSWIFEPVYRLGVFVGLANGRPRFERIILEETEGG